jgi:NAD(P)-dependent dehydrogenase (short-subunit alcohol dehydrogenase family)
MIVLCTGCRSGFGLLIAVSAARAGHTVYAGLRTLESKDALVEASRGLDVHPIQLDVIDADQRRAAVDRILKEQGRIDALVNNAGVGLGGFLETVADDELRGLFDINVFAPFELTKLCLPSMRAQRDGIVINISSMSGQNGLPGLGAYAGSKFALEGLTEALRHEMRPFGVRVVLVEPGPYRTDIFARNRRMARAADDPESPYYDYMKRMEALADKMESRMGDPQDVADLVVRVLANPHPRLRYALGPGVRARLLAKRLLPFAATEVVLKRIVGF